MNNEPTLLPGSDKEEAKNRIVTEESEVHEKLMNLSESESNHANVEFKRQRDIEDVFDQIDMSETHKSNPSTPGGSKKVKYIVVLCLPSKYQKIEVF